MAATTETGVTGSVELENGRSQVWQGIFKSFVSLHEKTGRTYADMRPVIRHNGEPYLYGMTLEPRAYFFESGRPKLVVIDAFPLNVRSPIKRLIALAEWDGQIPNITDTEPSTQIPEDKQLLRLTADYLKLAINNFDPNNN